MTRPVAETAAAADAIASGMTQPSLREATAIWFRIGCLSFGGAAAQVAMLHRVVVDEKRWVEERRFLDALNYCTLLPGPEAQQLATYLGFILHGVRGGVIAGLLFVIPGALVMMALCFLYVLGRGLGVVEGIFFGIKAAVIAIVIEALLKIGKRALKTPFLLCAAATSFVTLAFLDVDFPVVILAAAVAGLLLSALKPGWLGRRVQTLESAAPAPGQTAAAFRAALVWTVIWWAPVGLAAAMLGPAHLLVDVGLFFSKLAMITFGGAYAVLAYLADAAVHDKGWVSAAEMIDGLGLAETTPGPTILVNQFAAFLAGWRQPQPFPPAVAASLSALMAVWVTFAPSFVWIFAGSPFVERVRSNPRIAGALSVITAAVAGVIASLVLKFALGVLFEQVQVLHWGALQAPVPVVTTLNWAALLLAIGATVLLFRLHRGVIETVLWLGAAGIVVTFLKTFV
ncbi:MAG: chromate efflux transporter [Hyphomicrobiales bacterium]|nr:chromate efflux transporter [Hyphomicrobiales bacterium]